jgi:hypothetical protein
MLVGYAVRLLGVAAVLGRHGRFRLLARHLRDRQGIACGLLLALPYREVGVERHAEDGDEDAHHVPHGEGVVQQGVAERQDQASLEVAQDLVRHRRRRPDHQERTEVHGHRDQARQDDEALQTEHGGVHGQVFFFIKRPHCRYLHLMETVGSAGFEPWPAPGWTGLFFLQFCHSIKLKRKRKRKRQTNV